ncbi:uncharacterized protein LOC110657428 isoform X2 [Hevea brasiliensis]|uniref:uncharacterized protein LOC110657428 isoform X2 n=1 Tax=Hevea brasiliensis TaxID=3981 RepID=UPI0025DFE012|nr:uncharacterized protein LOC110657428 isoform X2 [Hevea brasiliensis]
MASLSTIFPLRSYCSCNYVSTHRSITTATSPASLDLRFSFSSNPKERRVLEHVGKPLSAVGSGLEASITDPKDNAITLKNAEVVLESKEENKIQLRVDLPGDETQKVFDKVLIDLGRSAPPIPGFRRQKGGKTSKVSSLILYFRQSPDCIHHNHLAMKLCIQNIKEVQTMVSLPSESLSLWSINKQVQCVWIFYRKHAIRFL